MFEDLISKKRGLFKNFRNKIEEKKAERMFEKIMKDVRENELDVYKISEESIKRWTGLNLTNIEKARLMKITKDVLKQCDKEKKEVEKAKRKGDKEKLRALGFSKIRDYYEEVTERFFDKYYGIRGEYFEKMFPGVKNKKGKMVASPETIEYFKKLQDIAHNEYYPIEEKYKDKKNKDKI
jgi:transcription termination factor NusB